MTFYFSPSTLSGCCNRKTTLVQKGWRRKLPTNDTVFGEAIHRYAALRAQGIPKSLAEIEALLIVKNTPKIIRIKWLTEDYFNKVLMEWESNPKRVEYLTKPDGKLAVEFSLGLPLKDITGSATLDHKTGEVVKIEDIVLTGTMDGLVSTKEGVAIYDIKTTAKSDPDLTEYQLSAQFLHYPALLFLFAKRYPESWIALEVVPKLKHVIIESVQFKYNDMPIIEQFKFPINLENLEYYTNKLINHVQSTTGSMEPTGLFHGSCMSGKDYTCEMFEICARGDFSQHVQQEYNPIKRHEESKR